MDPFWLAGAWFCQVAEISAVSAIRIAVVVAGLLSVPGLRHVGAQFYESIICEGYIAMGSFYPYLSM